MVLRGQPVGEQGAADRWTALDPYAAGSGAGAPRGDPLRGAPLSFLPISFSRGPSGALFPCRGGLRPSAAPPGRQFAGRAEPPISAAGPDGAFPAARPLPPGAVLAGEGALAPSGAEGPCPRARGACGRMPPRTARPFTGAAPRGPPRQVAVPPGAGGLAGIPRGPLRRPPAAPAGQGPGARPAGTVRGRRFSCLEPGRPPCPPSWLKRNRRIIPRAPAPLREWACGPSRLRSFE